MLMKFTEPAIKQLALVIQATFKEGLVAAVHEVTSTTGITVVAQLLTVDKGRVSLQRTSGAQKFVIRSVEDGKPKFAQLAIPMRTYDHEPFASEKDFAEVVQRTLCAARKRWNLLNSGGEPYEEKYLSVAETLTT